MFHDATNESFLTSRIFRLSISASSRALIFHVGIVIRKM